MVLRIPSDPALDSRVLELFFIASGCDIEFVTERQRLLAQRRAVRGC